MPAFDASYAGIELPGRKPATDEMKMMLPPASMTGSAALVMRKCERRLTEKT